MATASKRTRPLCSVALLGNVPMPATTALPACSTWGLRKHARGFERNNTKTLALQRIPKPYTFQRTLGRYKLRFTDMAKGLDNARTTLWAQNVKAWERPSNIYIYTTKNAASVLTA